MHSLHEKKKTESSKTLFYDEEKYSLMAWILLMVGRRKRWQGVQHWQIIYLKQVVVVLERDNTIQINIYFKKDNKNMFAPTQSYTIINVRICINSTLMYSSTLTFKQIDKRYFRLKIIRSMWLLYEGKIMDIARGMQWKQSMYCL